MESINGCTVIAPTDASGFLSFGPDETQGAYFVMTVAGPPGQAGPPLHTHPQTDEMFYVAEGEATFQFGDRVVQGTAGCLVFVPRGMPHTVWNSGDGPLKGLIIVSPGGAEHEFVPVEAG